MKLTSPTTLVFVFSFAGIAALLSGNWVAAAAFATAAAGFALAGQASAADLALVSHPGASSLPAWRRDSSWLLVCTAITLFGVEIGQALHQAVNHLSH
ncbi:hypothetical protein ACFST9_19650 [Hymenobacter monticola]|uniref:Uncharacterized protein n=1 Tax=Hymenobacter monticola TaxID=1705399 RepID=A0ABY4AYC2_9BACT|nr:hypothetical protein [Hymenobacter monticola]UOE31881.1 hypothetical protein MTP16_12115 [Hymenobacter monticola]